MWSLVNSYTDKSKKNIAVIQIQWDLHVMGKPDQLKTLPFASHIIPLYCILELLIQVELNSAGRGDTGISSFWKVYHFKCMTIYSEFS